MVYKEEATKAIINHHLIAFGENNLDEILKDYTEDSLVFTSEGVLNGVDEIRKCFEKLFKLIPTGSEFEMKSMNIKGNAAHIIWSSQSEEANISFGTDSFLIENEKISVHTISAFIQ